MLIKADQPVADYWITVTVRGRKPATPPDTFIKYQTGAIKFSVADVTCFLTSGQRYDVLITADQPVANYWITVTVRGRKPATTPGTWALQYAGAPAGVPTTNASALAAQQPAWDNQNFTLAQVSLHSSNGHINGRQKLRTSSAWPTSSSTEATRVRVTGRLHAS